MEESQDLKKSKDRSPSFPFITLDRALERVKQFFGEEKRGVAPYTRAVLHWKYSNSSSGGLQTVSSLKAYGLLDEVGGTAKARQFKLSDLALRIILDQRPDSVERMEFMRIAAKSPSVAAEVYEKWPDGLPSDSTLNHFLVLDRKFSEAAAVTAVKIIKQNHILTEMDRGEVESSSSEPISEKPMETTVVNAPAQAADTPSRGPAQSSVKMTFNQPQLVLRHKGMSILIEFSQEPSKEALEYLASFAKFQSENAPTQAEMEAQASKPSAG